MLLHPDYRMPLAELANLTDWQIEHLYLIPAKERAERLEAEREGKPPPLTRAEKAELAAEKPGTRPPPPRAYMISVMCGMLGMSVEDANTEYDRQMAENQNPVT